MTQKAPTRSANDELLIGTREGSDSERGKDWGGPKDYRSASQCPPSCTCIDPYCCDSGCCSV